MRVGFFNRIRGRLNDWRPDPFQQNEILQSLRENTLSSLDFSTFKSLHPFFKDFYHPFLAALKSNHSLLLILNAGAIFNAEELLILSLLLKRNQDNFVRSSGETFEQNRGAEVGGSEQAKNTPAPIAALIANCWKQGARARPESSVVAQDIMTTQSPDNQVEQSGYSSFSQ